MDFAEIVPVSALKNDNTEELIKCIMAYLPYGPAFFDEDTITDQPERQPIIIPLWESFSQTILASISTIPFRYFIRSIVTAI